MSFPPPTAERCVAARVSLKSIVPEMLPEILLKSGWRRCYTVNEQISLLDVSYVGSDFSGIRLPASLFGCFK